MFFQIDLNGHLPAFIIGYELNSGHTSSLYRRAENYVPVTTPPSTLSTVPVMKDAWSDASHA